MLLSGAHNKGTGPDTARIASQARASIRDHA
jgi:hypothetical protein